MLKRWKKLETQIWKKFPAATRARGRPTNNYTFLFIIIQMEKFYCKKMEMNFYTRNRINIHLQKMEKKILFPKIGKQNPFQKLEGVSLTTTNTKGTRKEKQCNVNFCKSGSAPSIPCGKAHHHPKPSGASLVY